MDQKIPFDPSESLKEVDFEEITSDEVDRIVEALDGLAESTDSENIRHYLSEAADRIYELIYGEESDGPLEEAA